MKNLNDTDIIETPFDRDDILNLKGKPAGKRMEYIYNDNTLLTREEWVYLNGSPRHKQINKIQEERYFFLDGKLTGWATG